MAKRTYASVTEDPCTCNYLQYAAEDPENPIRFDSATAEYQFWYEDGMLVIYHCPFCGGAAPESQRSLLFATIPDTEVDRLAELLEGIHTREDAFTKLGKPDFEDLSPAKYPEREGKPPRVEHQRNFRYHNFFDVAEIWFTEMPDGKIHWHLQGKYLG